MQTLEDRLNEAQSANAMVRFTLRKDLVKECSPRMIYVKAIVCEIR